MTLSLAGVCEAALSTDAVPLSAVKAEAVPVIWRVQLEGRVSVRLPNPGLTMEIGRQLPLFQQTERDYVAIVESADGTPALAVFPRVTSGGYTAWITAERQLVFSQRTRSLAGAFTFDENETLPLVRETPPAFLVQVERYGRRIAFPIPRQTKGVNLVPVPLVEPKPAVAPAAPAPLAATAPPVAAVPVAMPPAAEIPEAGIDEDAQELSVEQIKNEVLSGIMVEVDRLRQERAAKMAAEAEAEARKAPEPAPVVAVAPEPVPVVVTQIVQVVTREVPAAVAAPPPLPSGSWFESMLAFYDTHAIRILQGCVVILLVLLLVVEMDKRRRRSSAGAAAMPAKSTAVNQVSTLYSVSSVGESVTQGPTGHAMAPAATATMASRPKPTPATSTQHADLGGTLDGAMLPQVVQYFTSSRESGRLRIRREDGTEEYLFFDSGRIIDAQSGGINGRDAAYRILLRRGGSFVFSRGDCSNHQRTIREDSMAILLEAHQMMDEAADGRRA